MTGDAWEEVQRAGPTDAAAAVMAEEAAVAEAAETLAVAESAETLAAAEAVAAEVDESAAC